LYGKLHNRDKAEQVDVEKTIHNFKERIIGNRRETGVVPIYRDALTQDEARQLWDALIEVENEHSELSIDAFTSILYHELGHLRDIRQKIVCEEDFYHDDIIVHTIDREANTFCEVVAPLFAEILKREVGATE
jgi:hypothetical protein